ATARCADCADYRRALCRSDDALCNSDDALCRSDDVLCNSDDALCRSDDALCDCDSAECAGMGATRHARRVASVHLGSCPRWTLRDVSRASSAVPAPVATSRAAARVASRVLA
ncbi:MAG TPA: hypothetical protein VLJ38_18780, partial [Polyangiaceae bacterium]|nr:hypothetical protein [Polyangiaceae bacterium]